MKTLDFIRLDANASNQVVNALQQLLADYHVFYANLRGLHWNIQGKKFFALHQKFEELYDEVADQIDEIAERILTLGGVPAHNLSAYLKVAKLKESDYVAGSEQAVKLVLDNLAYLIAAERTVIEVAGKANDEGTTAIMSDYIRDQEKLVWMYTAWLS